MTIEKTMELEKSLFFKHNSNNWWMYFWESYEKPALFHSPWIWIRKHVILGVVGSHNITFYSVSTSFSVLNIKIKRKIMNHKDRIGKQWGNGPWCHFWVGESNQPKLKTSSFINHYISHISYLSFLTWKQSILIDTDLWSQSLSLPFYEFGFFDSVQKTHSRI